MSITADAAMLAAPLAYAGVAALLFRRRIRVRLASSDRRLAASFETRPLYQRVCRGRINDELRAWRAASN